eukprot:4539607-Alexandrium_andersonii.AAC.1
MPVLHARLAPAPPQPSGRGASKGSRQQTQARVLRALPPRQTAAQSARRRISSSRPGGDPQAAP